MAVDKAGRKPKPPRIYNLGGTVLKGSPQTFNAAFGLGRVGRDLLDAEFFQSAAHLSGKLLSGQFLLARPVGIVALKDAMAITVQT